MNPICFYHSADLDGICSAAIVNYYVENCDFFGIDYGEPFPLDLVKGREVYMVDFSIQHWPIMQKVCDLADEFIWIDHHDTAIKAFSKYGLKGDFRGILEDKNEFAACELTWKFFCNDPIPAAVRYLGRYDIWDHEDKNTLPFQYGMRLLNPDPTHEHWSHLFEEGNDRCLSLISRTIEMGDIILQYERQQNLRAHKGVFRGMIKSKGKEYLTLFLNASGGSKVFDGCPLFDEDTEILCTYRVREDKVKYSLYAVSDDVHVGEIAKEKGGGGHKGAAGFSTNLGDFIWRSGEGVGSYRLAHQAGFYNGVMFERLEGGMPLQLAEEKLWTALGKE